jgi:hypothetical protein
MSNSLQSGKRFWIVITLAVVCGLFAGILGEIVTRVYILKDFSFPYLSGEVNLSNLDANSAGLVIRDAKKVVVNQDVKIAETINNIRPVLVGIFKETGSAAVSVEKAAYYKLDEPLFIGLIITSDGWVVATAPADLRAAFNPKNYVAIGNDRQLYEIDQLANFKGLPGNLLVFHLAGAANLPVKKIVSRSELSLGETLLVINNLNSVRPTTLTSLTKTPAVLSSDYLNARLDLAGAAENNFKSSFVFNLAGDLTAIIAADKEIIPAFSYNYFWQSLLKKDQPARPFLGLNYLDLSVVKTAALNLNKGAWLYPTDTQPAVVKNSPAQIAGLKAGDVVTWVNNQEIGVGNDLADVLSAYNAGDKITLTYLRAGVEKDLELKLGELK